MKMATPKSIAVWTAAAAVLIGPELASQRWPGIAQSQRLITAIAFLLMALSMRLMVDVPSHALFPSKANGAQRNLLNIGNIALGVLGALSFSYLAGLFGHPMVGSATFWFASGGLVASILFQATFAVTLRAESSCL